MISLLSAHLGETSPRRAAARPPDERLAADRVGVCASLEWSSSSLQLPRPRSSGYTYSSTRVCTKSTRKAPNFENELEHARVALLVRRCHRARGHGMPAGQLWPDGIKD